MRAIARIDGAVHLFVLLASAYLLSFSGLFHSTDEWLYLAGAEQVSQGQISAISSHGIAFSVLAAPFYGLAEMLPRVGTFQAVSLLNIPVTAGTAVLLMLYVQRLGYSGATARLVAVIYGLGSLAWPYSKFLFREPLGAFGLVAAAYALLRFKQKPSAIFALGALLWTGVAIGAKVAIGAAVPFLAFYGGASVLGEARRVAIAHLRPTLRLAGIVAALGTGVGVGLLTVGFLIKTYATYSSLLITPLLEGLGGLFLSPGVGLFVYVPLLWVGVVGLYPFFRRHPAEAVTLLGSTLLYASFAAGYQYWWGGWSWGPRYLVPFLPFLFVLIAPVLEGVRRRPTPVAVLAIGCLCLLSMVSALLGVLIPFGDYLASVRAEDINQLHALVNWNPRYSPLLGHLSLLGDWTRVDLAWLQGRGSGTPTFNWLVILPTAGLALLGAAGLWGRPAALFCGSRSLMLGIGGCIAVGVMGWVALHQYYLDERYDFPVGYRQAIERIAGQSRAGDGVLLELWWADPLRPINYFQNYCKGRCPPRYDLVRETFLPYPDWESRLENIAASHSRLWLLLNHLAPQDPNSRIEHWLDARAYKLGCTWTSPEIRLCLYATPQKSVTIASGTVQKRLGENIVLSKYQIGIPGQPNRQNVAAPGDTLLLSLWWRASGVPGDAYTVFIQLLDSQGRVRNQIDRQPADGFRPTNTWSSGEEIEDRYGLTLPGDLEVSSYRVIVGMYKLPSGARLPVINADGVIEGDHVLLEQVSVAASPAR